MNEQGNSERLASGRRRRLTAAELRAMSPEEYRAYMRGGDSPHDLAQTMGQQVEIAPQDLEALRRWLLDTVEDLELLSALDPSPERKRRLLRYIRRWAADATNHDGRLTATDPVLEALYAQACSLGPLEDLLRDPAITEITVQRPDRVLVMAEGRSQVARGVAFPGGEEEVKGWIRYLAGLAGIEVGGQNLQPSFTLRDGSRVVLTYPPMGLSISIRRKREHAWTLEDWIERGSLTEEMASWLKEVFATGRLGVLFAGGSGSGKTSLLEALLPYLPIGNVILVQDNPEIKAEVHPTITALMADPRYPRGPQGLRQVATGAMMQAPSALIAGEIKNDAVVALLMAVDAGTGGAATTCHSQSAAEAYTKMQTYCLEDEGYRVAGAEAIYQALARTFPVCVHLKRSTAGRIYVSEILQVEWGEAEGNKPAGLRYVPTFTGAEQPGVAEIFFAAGPGLDAPIERVREQLMLLRSAGENAEVLLRRDARQQAAELFRQAAAAARVEDYTQAVNLMEQAVALDNEDKRLAAALAEYRVLLQDRDRTWKDRLSVLRAEMEAAMGKGDEGEEKVRALLLRLDSVGGSHEERQEVRSLAEDWLAQRRSAQAAFFGQVLAGQDARLLLAWGELLWRRGEEDWARRFFARLVEVEPGNYAAQIYAGLLELA